MNRILYFTAAWCGPCRKFGPVLTREAHARGLHVQRVDLDDDPAGLALAYEVQSVPTVLVVRDTPSRDVEIVARFGAVGVTALADHLDAVCGR